MNDYQSLLANEAAFDDLIRSLDDKARQFDAYEYGLPMHGEGREILRQEAMAWAKRWEHRIIREESHP